MITTVIGTVLIHISLDNISKWLKEGLLKDRFNLENESFEQCEEVINDKYSVNIPMRYYWKGKFRKGSINITNPFRGTWVVGTPGSGKTFSVIEPFIRQHSKKGFAMVVYDYKWPTLAQKLYYSYCMNKKQGVLHGAQKDFQFNVINFVDVSHSEELILSNENTYQTWQLHQKQLKRCWNPYKRERKKVEVVVTSSSRHQPSTFLPPAFTSL
jgi:Cdc6-like AAA superfamily ATPase